MRESFEIIRYDTGQITVKYHRQPGISNIQAWEGEFSLVPQSDGAVVVDVSNRLTGMTAAVLVPQRAIDALLDLYREARP